MDKESIMYGFVVVLTAAGYFCLGLYFGLLKERRALIELARTKCELERVIEENERTKTYRTNRTCNEQN